MFRMLTVAVGIVVAAPAIAEDKTKPNTLTPKEIAEGWILLFDGETSYGWKPIEYKDSKKADISVKDGCLVISGKGFPLLENTATAKIGPKVPNVQLTTRFECFDLVGEYRHASKGTGLQVRVPGEICYSWLKPSSGDEWTPLHVKLTPEETIIRAVETGKPHQMTGRVTDPMNNEITGGGYGLGRDALVRFGFVLPYGEEGKIELRNLKLRPANTKPLFNGKSLDGWSINKADPKRMSSKWEVTSDGELSLKNGPGDLVSEKEFDNFVLQVECKSLGKWLNSGVFFRCIPGQYQNGYEAQIQNGFMGNDRTKPVDFGTGAIYRRIPARKVVSNDNEWFTMTIVADGRHIATWVDGYQTVDWTDERPANENPRNGYREAKGPLSIQGHDATTDLLFRNIRVAEMPVEKK